MKKPLALIFVATLLAGGSYWLAKRGNSSRFDMPLMQANAEPAVISGTERKPAYYYDPMRPDQHFDAPGKSPFMDMQLVPKYADEQAGASGTVSIDPQVVQNLGIRTATVTRRRLSQTLRVSGSIAADENRIEVVQTRAAGWVERLHVRAVGEPVHKGQLLAELYAPELYAAQQEFLLAAHTADRSLSNAARQRLSFLGLTTAAITQLEKSGVAQRRVSSFAPISGVVTELGVREGSQVSPGMSLFTLSDLSQVWLNAEVPEALANQLTKGTVVAAQVPALAGKRVTGRVDYLLPSVDMQTRTNRVRVVLANSDGLLKPGMFADVELGDDAADAAPALSIPSEAVIRTGTRSVVIVAEAGGRFRPVQVRLGREQDGQTEVLDGLEDGQQVVASGQFLIDSEANLRGAFETLDASKREPAP